MLVNDSYRTSWTHPENNLKDSHSNILSEDVEERYSGLASAALMSDQEQTTTCPTE